MSDQSPTLHRASDVIRSGPLSRSTFYRLAAAGRIELIRVGRRMTLTKETGAEIALRVAREDAAAE
jgi:hypothetical protein